MLTDISYDITFFLFLFRKNDIELEAVQENKKDYEKEEIFGNKFQGSDEEAKKNEEQQPTKRKADRQSAEFKQKNRKISDTKKQLKVKVYHNIVF